MYRNGALNFVARNMCAPQLVTRSIKRIFDDGDRRTALYPSIRDTIRAMSLQESVAPTYNNVTVASCNVTRRDKRILGNESHGH